MNTSFGNMKLPYDTLFPEKTVTDFLSFLRTVKSRYDGNVRALEEAEAQLQDLEHYAELNEDLDCADGYGVYRKIRDIRRQRRAYKNENELLTPLYQWITEDAAEVKKLERALGETRRKAELIDKRQYMARTDVLEEREDGG